MGYHDSYAVDRIQPLVLHDRGCHEFRVDLHSRNHPCQTGIESIDSDIVILDFHNGDVLYPYRVIRCDGNNGKAVFPAAWRKEILAFRNEFLIGISFLEMKQGIPVFHIRTRRPVYQLEIFRCLENVPHESSCLESE